MIKHNTFTFLTALFFCSCTVTKYFHDEASYKRQNEIKKNRSSNVAGDVALGVLSVFTSAAFDMDVDWMPTQQEFKKIKLINTAQDTIYVNMLTDLEWDVNDYCDFMDIRIPPHSVCKILVPTDAVYNLYYSNTPQSDDDLLMEIYTTYIKKLKLNPGITIANDTLQLEDLN